MAPTHQLRKVSRNPRPKSRSCISSKAGSHTPLRNWSHGPLTSAGRSYSLRWISLVVVEARSSVVMISPLWSRRPMWSGKPSPPWRRPGGLMPRRILIIDNEPHICESLKDRLESRGYEVIVAHDGQTALALVALEASRSPIEGVLL